MKAQVEPPHVKKIRAHAKSLQISVSRLMALAGVADSQFRRWKRGDTEPRPATIERILAVTKPTFAD